MSVLTVAFASLLGIVLLATLVAERGIKSIGLAPHKVKFPGPKALPFFGNFLEVSPQIEYHTSPLLTLFSSFAKAMLVHSSVGRTSSVLSFASSWEIARL